MEPLGHTEDLSLNTAHVRTILTGFIRDTVHASGLRGVVLGLSGGVDSAVAASLAAEALGAEQVLGILMPYRTSSASSRTDAGLVVTALGIRSLTVDISPMVDAYLGAGGGSDRVRAGNVMARQRMIVLYDHSARETALVMGTGNKTETLLGYGTLYGDTACAFNPLGDLYKTQVWQLASALGVPPSIIAKRPSADLWEGQTDEGELGFTYRDVDRLLSAAIDGGKSDDELHAMGFSAPFVGKVRDMVRKNQFKRRLPLVAKLSDRTVTVDFRHSRDWGL
jgi:NAD+ synthase